jgi:hypothetical protein
VRHLTFCFAIGGAANVLCRRDLARNTLLGGALFAGMCAIFMMLLVATAPGYVEQVWNQDAHSGVRLGAIPLEELAFAFAFGMYGAGNYEHFTWQHGAVPPTAARIDASHGGQHG